jgi:hypothetical protein
MKSEENNFLVKKEYESLERPEIVRFGNDFLKEFIFTEDANVISITAFRIICKIANDLRNSNFTKNQSEQLSLFDATFKNELNTYARFTIKKSEIAVGKNYRSLEKALEILLDYKKGWYTVTNLKGESSRSFSALVKDVTHNKGLISLLVPVYWLEKFTYLPAYNSYLNNVINNTSNNNHVFFYLWVKTIIENGSTVNFNNFNKRYHLKYRNANDLAKGFLKPIKAYLDTNADVSFNYSASKELIKISVYHNSKGKLLNEKNIKKVSLSQSTHYWGLRHKLDKSEKLRLKNAVRKEDFYLFERAYQCFVKQMRAEKRKVVSITGSEFIEVFQEKVIEQYANTPFAYSMPNGYPKI